MKNRLLILCLLIFITLACGCLASSKDPIEGTWQLYETDSFNGADSFAYTFNGDHTAVEMINSSYLAAGFNFSKYPTVTASKTIWVIGKTGTWNSMGNDTYFVLWGGYNNTPQEPESYKIADGDLYPVYNGIVASPIPFHKIVLI